MKLSLVFGLVVVAACALAAPTAPQLPFSIEEIPSEYRPMAQSLLKVATKLPLEYQEKLAKLYSGMDISDLKKVAGLFEDYASYSSDEEFEAALAKASPAFFSKMISFNTTMTERIALLHPEAAKLVTSTLTRLDDLCKKALRTKQQPPMETMIVEGMDIGLSLSLLSQEAKVSLVQTFPEVVQALRDPKIKELLMDFYTTAISSVM